MLTTFRYMIRELLEKARLDLLDFGLRNNFINTRDSVTKSLRVVEESSLEVFKILVENGLKMSFDSKKKVNDDLEYDEFAELFKLPPLEQIDTNKLTDNILQTNHSDQDLQKRLRSIDRLSKLHIEEKGVNMLFLALGFVRWYESESSDKPRLAPLLLIPVQLNRISVNSRFKVNYNDDELGVNVSFFEKLKVDFGIKIKAPDDLDSSNLESFFAEIKSKVKLNRWEVLDNEIRLGLFSFSKFLMYNDLDEKQWPKDYKPYDHNLLSPLLGEGFSVDSNTLISNTELFDKVAYEETYHVLPSDSSQQEVIFSVRSGLNTIVQGPPGTGKSQTITNIISDFLARGKKVLFVAEKLAALKVVSNKLETLGLDRLALELHSNKANKKTFIEELGKVMDLSKPNVNISISEELNSAESLREIINNYSEGVNLNVKNYGFSPIQAFGNVLISSSKLKEDIYQVDLERIKLDSKEGYINKKQLVKEISQQLKQSGSFKENVFNLLRPSKFSFYDSEQFISELKELKVELSSLKPQVERLNKLSVNLPESSDLSSIKILINSLDLINSFPEKHIRLKFDNSSYEDKNVSSQISQLISSCIDIKKEIQKYDDIVFDKFWDQDVFVHYTNLNNSIKKWYKFIIPSYNKSKKNIRGYFKNNLVEDQELLDLCKTNVDSFELNSKIIKSQNLIEGITQQKFNSYKDQWEIFKNTIDWYDIYLDQLSKQKVYPELLRLVYDEKLNVDFSLDKLESFYKKAEKILSGASFINSKDYCSYSINELYDYLDTWISNEQSFNEYIQIVKNLDLLRNNDLDWLQDILDNWNGSDKYLIEIFDYYWFKSIARISFNERPILDRFIGENHSNKVSEYCKLEDILLNINIYRVLQNHWDNIPKASFGAGKLGVLKKELSKKRKLKSIRKLISECGDVILDLKPLFLMSPMSVAQFIENNSLLFDVVIFDEASQIKPVEAFGSILRAKQLVVVGDSKQLPPTSFFDSAINEDEEEDESEELKTTDVESILALAGAKNLPEQMLRWHYRSRHESLITVSNREFYNSNLLVFPSADSTSLEKGLHHELSKDSYFLPGKGGRVNKGEAKLIVKRVFEHAKNNQNKTLGVVAFSQSQARIIQDYIEQELRVNPNPGVEKYLFEMHENERFFVKNLENVQGDERDVIIISVGYGYQENGKFSYNFGPINKEGGERRLNVLFSRAKEKCIVYSNFRGDELDLSRTDSYGVKILKSYLVYSERREIELPEITNGLTDSFFEDHVSEVLVKNGFDITNQVGSAGFKIDIGVKHPSDKGRYVLAVECDGATYHSSKIARDRDKARQIILESLGWKFYRIWSTDWFLNPERESAKLIEAVKNSFVDSTPNKKIEEERKIQIGFEEVGEIETFTSSYFKYSKKIYLSEELHNYAGLYSLIKDIITCEQPIHRDVILFRVLELTEVARAGKRIQSEFDYQLKSLIKNEPDLIKDGEFYSTKAKMVDVSYDGMVRERSSQERKEFKMEYVSDFEIKNAILYLIKHSYGLIKDELLSEVPKVFGFKVIKDDQRDLVAKNLRSLIRLGLVISLNDNLSLK